MKADWNMSPGTGRKDIEPPQDGCEECGEPLFTDEEHRVGLCEDHLRIVVQELPE